MIFLQGATRPNSTARRCLDLVDRGEIDLFLSPAIWAEIDDVLTRPKTLSKFPDLTRSDVRQFLRAIQAKARTLTNVQKVFDYARDPKDEPYVNLAVAAKVTFLVTRDNDLLDLMRHDTIAGGDFHRRFESLEIVTPEEFLAKLNRVK
jgi:putative PIN family toxin of toxin-antitoxin system